jgi:hypothetical protein
VAEVVYFLSGEDGKTELSDGETVVGHIETVGLAFEIKPVAGFDAGRHGSAPVSIEARSSRSGRIAHRQDM